MCKDGAYEFEVVLGLVMLIISAQKSVDVMRKAIKLILFLWLFIAVSSSSWAGDYEDGLDAYNRGNYPTAIYKWKKAAEQGLASAQFNLGIMYDFGRGHPQDDVEAIKWYRLAAEQGLASAQFNLGNMYDFGQGVPQDHVEAIKWYRLAAEQGLVIAQFNLGIMYDFGRGHPQDDVEAIKWYRLAAEQGLASAQLNLGVSYANGKGVIQDNVYAHMWFNIVASKGDEKATKYRNQIQKSMSKEDVSVAQKLARECVAIEYKDC